MYTFIHVNITSQIFQEKLILRHLPRSVGHLKEKKESEKERERKTEKLVGGAWERLIRVFTSIREGNQ